MTPRALRAPALVAACSLLLATAGCSPVPQESAVERGPALAEAPRQEVSVEVEPPAPDATPVQVVEGFLRAGMDAADDYGIARQYLTPQASASWRPERQVTVHDESLAPGMAQVVGGRVQVNLGLVARVDSSGALEEAEPGSREDLDFQLQQVDGQWRISAVPQGHGLFMTRADFQRLYRPLSVHWGSPVTEALVPETRWVRDGDGTASALGRMQTEPVPDHLVGAVQTGAPDGTVLESAAVPVSEGVATVRFADSMNGTDAELRRLAWAQYTATLTQAVGVDAVTLMAGDRALSAGGADVGEQISFPEAVGYAIADAEVPLVLLHQRQRLEAADPTSAELAEAPLPQSAVLPTVPTGWERLAVSSDVRTFAAVDGRRMAFWRDGEQTTVEADGRLSAPSLDALGFVWTTAQVEGRGQVEVADTGDGRPAPRSLETAWVQEQSVEQVRISPDGTRALLVVDDGDRDRVMVAGVVRGTGGEPVSLASPRAIVPAATTVQDLAWIDDQSLVVLAEPGPDGEQPVWRSDLGGWTEAQEPVDNAVSVAGYPDDRADGILITTEGGRVLTKAGSTWLVAQAASEVVVPGR